ncbi:hypothetical protein GCM10009802_13040 [Streptomyces synnematoformans]|uniref:Uncharacterized protein n=1 Tax=Streptomyces synnematoformans TaxID=415721 RepID=A0ABN2XM29_9ACTN
MPRAAPRTRFTHGGGTNAACVIACIAAAIDRMIAEGSWAKAAAANLVGVAGYDPRPPETTG